MSDTEDSTVDPTRYAYKPALVGVVSEFELQPDAIAWDRAGRVVRVPYRDIRRVRLAFRPVTMQSHRFVAEIWVMGGHKLTIASCSVRSMFEQTRQDAEYSAFLTELHRRLVPFGGAIRFQTGSPFLLYWIGVAVIAALCVAGAMLVLRAAQAENYTGASLIAAMLAFFLWQASAFLRRNKPNIYRPDAVPRQLLPE